jgi:hypothetical protein
VVFCFSQKKVKNGGNGHWHKVEDTDVYGEDYRKYNCIVIGRALVLSKLEEGAKLWSIMSEQSFKDPKCSYVDAIGAFVKKMGDVIYFRKCHPPNAKSKLWKKLKEIKDIVYSVVGQVTRYMETYKAKEMELNAKCKRK